MLTTHSNQPFHLVDYSPWPLTGAIGAMIMVSGLSKWFKMLEMNYSNINYSVNNMSVMASCSTSSNMSSTSYHFCIHCITMSNNFIYYIKSIILCIIFLSML